MTEINGFKINSKTDPEYSNAKKKQQKKRKNKTTFEIWGSHQL